MIDINDDEQLKAAAKTMELEEYLNTVCGGGASLTWVRDVYSDEQIEALLSTGKADLIGYDDKENHFTYNSMTALQGNYEWPDIRSLTYKQAEPEAAEEFDPMPF
jgi:hypothetical protein